MRNIQYNNRDDRPDMARFAQLMAADNQARLAELQACLAQALREEVTDRQRKVLFL